jgi:lipoprotein NlpI
MIRISNVKPSKKFRGGLLLVSTALSLLIAKVALAADKVSYEELQSQGKAAFANGKRDEAVALVTQAIAVEPKNPRGYFIRARFHEENRDSAKAIADYDQALKIDPRLTDAWQRRGSEHFKLGHIKESIADFDKFIEMVPQQAPYHWQRGISYYYAGRFEEGRKQFELHQTVNSNDVENAVWHFLCVARAAGVDKARAALIPIKGDARVPMMEVHALFALKVKPEDVLKAAGAGGPSTRQLNHQLFYAHLYLGLYFEAIGDDKQAREHIMKAAGQYRTDDYMGDVARVHLQLRWPNEKSSSSDDKTP